MKTMKSNVVHATFGNNVVCGAMTHLTNNVLFNCKNCRRIIKSSLRLRKAFNLVKKKK